VPPPVTQDDATRIRAVIERSHQVYAEALANDGGTAALPTVYAGNRLDTVARLVNRRRAAGEYHVVRRRSIEYGAIQQVSADEARIETTEEWVDLLYGPDGRLMEDGSTRERDRYLLRSFGGEWRIVEDDITRLPPVPAAETPPLTAPAWMVILESLPVAEGKTRQDADAIAAQIRSRGYEAGVLLSSEFRSLNPGYWMVYSGRFQAQHEASIHAERLRMAGYQAPYPREVAR
jgi:hypothetical protein